MRKYTAESAPQTKKTNVIQLLGNFIKRHSPEQLSLVGIEAARGLKPVDDVSGILNTLFNYGGQQEDAHDCIMYLLDMIPDMAKMFTLKYESKMQCRACRHETAPRIDSEIFIDIPEFTPLTNEPTDIATYIKCHYQLPDDYKCEKCQIRGECQQISTISELPRVIMIVFKKYTGKSVRLFPETLTFGRHIFTVVAQIEHAGNQGGGHYYLRAKRAKPPQMYEKMARRGTLSAELLEHVYKLSADPMGIFVLDDDRANISFAGFVPTPNTYVVFYELFTL
jgi:ubiquitin C-terminal hydrolase